MKTILILISIFSSPYEVGYMEAPSFEECEKALEKLPEEIVGVCVEFPVGVPI